MFEFPLLYALASMPMLIGAALPGGNSSETASNNIQYCCNNTVGLTIIWLHVRLHIRNYACSHTYKKNRHAGYMKCA
jgi:hypothetical protein